MSGQTKFK